MAVAESGDPEVPVRPRRHGGRRAALLLVGLCVLYLGYRFIFGRGPKPIAVRMATVVSGPLTVSLMATESGSVEADTEVRVIPRVSGILTRLLAKEGDRVRAGQVLAVLDRDDADVQLREARARVGASDARLRQAGSGLVLQVDQSAAEIERARAGLRAAIEAERAASSRAAAQPEQTRQAVRQAEARVDAARAAVDLSRRGARREVIAQAEAALSQAQASAKEAGRSRARLEALLKQGAVSQSDVDVAVARADAADAAVRTAEQQLLVAKDQTLPEELRSAEARLREAQEALASARTGQVQNELQRREARAAAARVSEAQAQLRAAKAGARQIQLRQEERAAALAALDQSRAGLDQARTRFRYTTVTAPVSGLVAQVNVKEGEFILGGATFGLGASQLAILTLIDEHRLWLKANLDEADLPRVRLGQPVLVHSDAYPRRPFHGKVVEIAPVAQTQRLEARTFRVKVSVDDAGGRLRPGMSGDLEILVQQIPRALSLPTRALVVQGERRRVYRVVGGVAHLTPVVVGASTLTQTEILSGLHEGDLVVSSSDAEGLAEGVQVVDRPKA
ncbi:MAG TPA: efflux RND transporter periplasmic adaptor subunit [Armatimonadota bacterium]|jgi:RND family efflux transporter MFP subunit